MGPGRRGRGASRGRLWGQPGERAAAAALPGAVPASVPSASAAEPGGGVRLLPSDLDRASAEAFRGRPSLRTGRDGRANPPAGKGKPGRLLSRGCCTATRPPIPVAAPLGGRPRSAERRRGGTRDPVRLTGRAKPETRGRAEGRGRGGLCGLPPGRSEGPASEGWLPSAAPTEAAALRLRDICPAGPP